MGGDCCNWSRLCVVALLASDPASSYPYKKPSSVVASCVASLAVARKVAAGVNHSLSTGCC